MKQVIRKEDKIVSNLGGAVKTAIVQDNCVNSHVIISGDGLCLNLPGKLCVQAPDCTQYADCTPSWHLQRKGGMTAQP